MILVTSPWQAYADRLEKATPEEMEEMLPRECRASRLWNEPSKFGPSLGQGKNFKEYIVIAESEPRPSLGQEEDSNNAIGNDTIGTGVEIRSEDIQCELEELPPLQKLEPLEPVPDENKLVTIETSFRQNTDDALSTLFRA